MSPRFRGAYEDLVELILRLEARTLEREKHVLPVKPAWKRRIIEFPLNLAGAAIAGLLKSLPNSIPENFFLKMFDIITSNKYHSIGITTAESHASCSKIYRFIRSECSEPALICLTSHPPVLGEIRDLNLGLMGAGFRLMRAVRGTGRPFRLVAAVDVMALDTLPLVNEGLYAGTVGFFHVSTDRLPSKRNPLQRALFKRVAFDSAAWRLADALLARENVVMVHAGGVAETARLIYTTREFIWSLRQGTSKRPWEVLAALSSNPAFKSFLGNYQEGGNAWKRIEAFLIALLARDPLVQSAPRETLPPCVTGKLEDSDRGIVLSVTGAFGLEQSRGNIALAEFEDEFQRITPFRIRLFRILLQRVVAAGVPLMILPLDFSMEKVRPIIPRGPIAFLPGKTGGIEAVSLEDDIPVRREINSPSFFREWGKATFTL